MEPEAFLVFIACCGAVFFVGVGSVMWQYYDMHAVARRTLDKWRIAMNIGRGNEATDMGTRRLVTQHERQRQRLRRKIARLEAERDAMLRMAPFTFFARRLVLPLFVLLAIVMFLGVTLHSRPSDWSSSDTIFPPLPPIAILAIFVACVACFGYASWRLWSAPRPAQGNLWAYSDRIGHDGDSPRDIQARIDALRAQLARDDEARQ